jgi:hypothetical protein
MVQYEARFGMKPASDEAMMINHVGVTNVATTLTGESQFNISTPLGI